MKIATGDKRSLFSQQTFNLFLYILLFGASVQSIWIFFRGYSFPILDMFAFRQTQTALTAYGIDHGGPILGYETPVVGAPWAIPFEFPFFQWVVVGLRKMSGAPLDVCGRIISYTFFLLTFIPLKYIINYLYKEREAFVISAILLLASPLYLFWSRTFMIESAALFASVSFIAGTIRWVRAPSWPNLAVATLFATLAALQKATTFVPAAFVAGALVLDAVLRRAAGEPDGGRAIRKFASEALRLSPIALPVIVSIVFLEFWLVFSDHLKELNSIGNSLTSSALSGWNYGPWSLRSSDAFWTVVRNRMLPEAISSPYVVIAVLSGALALRPGFMRQATIIIAGFVAGLMIFSNLHFVHNYYQYAISIYLILTVALAVHEIGLHRPLLGALALLVLIVSAESTFYGKNSYFRIMLAGDQLRDGQIMQLAKFVAANTPQDSVVIGFGFDWSSELPYYAQRKGLMIPPWVADNRLKDLLAEPTRRIGELPVGAIVMCPPVPASQQALMDADAHFSQALADMNKTEIGICTVYHAPVPNAVLDGPPKYVKQGIAETCDGNIDFINGHPASASSKRPNKLIVEGWTALSAKEGKVADENFITLVDGNGAKTYIKTSKAARPDVKAAFGHPDMKDPGYKAVVNLSAIPGDLTLGLARVRDGQLHDCDNFGIKLGTP